jgi:hypothetical protein
LVKERRAGIRKVRLGGVLHGMPRRGPGSVCFGGYFRTLAAVAIVVARKIGLPDVINVEIAALCIGGGQRVAFGSTVTFRRGDGRVQKYRIVGEDEADPKAGSISFVSPVARFLMGKAVGDEVDASGQKLEIISIS